MNDHIINKICIYATNKKRRWQILDQFEEHERAEAAAAIDKLVESGDLFVIKGDTPATVESWDYFSRQAIDDEILRAIANGLTVDAAMERLKEGCRFSLPEEATELQRRFRMLIAAGAIKEKTAPKTSLSPPGNQDIKADAGKPLAGCLLEFGRALGALASVSTYGAERYGRGTWRHVERERYIDALMRHVLAMGADCAALDDESKLPHLAHVMWNAAALLEINHEESQK